MKPARVGSSPSVHLGQPTIHTEVRARGVLPVLETGDAGFNSQGFDTILLRRLSSFRWSDALTPTRLAAARCACGVKAITECELYW